MFNIEKYEKANSIKEAVNLLSDNPDSKLIAGGTDVLIRLREGHDEFSKLVDIHNLKELKFIEENNGNIKIGSGMTFSEIIENEIINKFIPVVAIAASTIGGPQVRNVATIGGNLCNGAISADSIGALAILDTELEVESKNGSRFIPILDFYEGPGKVVLKHDEILKAILIKKENYEDYGTHYYKYAMRNAMDIATIGCAVSCKIKNEIIEDLKMVFTVAGPKPSRTKTAEEFAIGKKINKELIEEISSLVNKDLNPRNSWRASKDFRLHIIKTLASRVLTQAVENSGVQL